MTGCSANSKARCWSSLPLWPLLLLIGCGNVSILMLARGTARLQELATRLAIGASRMRIVRQLLTESVIVSVAGGVLGMALAYAAIHFIVGLLPEYSIPHEVVIHLNVPVLSVQHRGLGRRSASLPASRRRCSFRARISARWFNPPARAARHRMVRAPARRSIMGQIALTVLMLAGAGAAIAQLRRRPIPPVWGSIPTIS